MLIVLSNMEQYDEAMKKFSDLKGMKILCDNPAFYDFLEEKELEFDKLDEELLINEWADINTWACEKALLWDSVVDVKALFKGIELNKALSAIFSYYLVAFLKNFLFAKLIYEKYDPEDIGVFRYGNQPYFPSFNGNLFLNVFLEGMSTRSKVEALSLREKKNEHKISGKEKMRKFLGYLFARLSKHGSSREAYLVYGEQRHLKSVIEEIRDRDEEVILFSPDFRLDLYRFCSKRKIFYLTEDLLRKNKLERESSLIDKEGIKNTFKALVKEGWFRYKDEDLSDLFYGILAETTDDYVKNVNKWFLTYERIATMFDIKGVIVDQNETSDKSFLAAFFKAKGIKSFCVSHGYGAVKFSLPEENRKYDLSKTFLHSEFERKLFEARGWSAKELCITGIPRYDSLVGLKKERSTNGKKNKKMTILYVGATMLEYTPDIASYMGVSYYEFGHNMRFYLKEMFEAIEPFSVRLVIKPHYVVDEEPIRIFVDKNGKNNDISIVPTSSDFFSLLADADAVFMGHWSTSLVECMNLEVPTFIMNYFNSENMFPFVEKGPCNIVRDKDQVEKTIRDLYQTFLKKQYLDCPPYDDGDKVYYMGVNDGNNTKRVVDCIIGV